MNILKNNKFYNEDCIIGAKKYLKDNSIDLIISDPPFGISGDKFHKHYNRSENYVLDGYIEIPKKEYKKFSEQWIKEAERVLKPGGAIYIVSGYTNLADILNALQKTELKEKNHIIWKYNFGVYTTMKFVSSHCHILYYVKPGKKHTFNTYSRYGADQKDQKERSLNYQDREDVWMINREYKHGKVKNKNELPKKLLEKIIQYSSNEGDHICDFFLGSFSTAKVAISMNRIAYGFEKSKIAFEHQLREIQKTQEGERIPFLTTSTLNSIPINTGKRWTSEEKKKLINGYNQLKKEIPTKKKMIEILSKEFGRGIFAITNVLKFR